MSHPTIIYSHDPCLPLSSSLFHSRSAIEYAGKKWQYNRLVNMALVLESWQKLSNASSIRSLVIDEERMRPGHWLWSMLCCLHYFDIDGWVEEKTSSP